MRRLLAISALFSVLVFAEGVLAASVFVIKGRGWGHSVGMSQWGAYGMVATGNASTHEAILAHYYRGTQIESRPAVIVRVLLASDRAALTIGSAQPFKVATKAAAPGDYKVTLTTDGRIRVWGVGVFPTPLRFSPGIGYMELLNKPYRGVIDVRRDGASLDARNAVEREAYLRGVVPGEVPSSWYGAVLRAQAVAARSWVMRSLKPPTAWFDVYPDTRSQVYGGVREEEASTNQAVADTAGQVLTYQGAIAQAFYHSSSGGRTASSADVWGGQLPYLQSEPDFDLAVPSNPHRLWRLNWTARVLAGQLGTQPPTDATLTRDGSGLAQVLTVKGPGWSSSIEGSERLRGVLDVKSARFWIGVLALKADRSRITYGDSVSLAGLARPPAGDRWTAYLERKRYGQAWKRDATPLAVTNGAWAKSPTPRITTSYRVVAGGVTGATSRVWVAVRVSFYEPKNATQLRGVVAPKRAGASVVIQKRRADGTWRTLKTVSTNAAGEFTANVSLTSGIYRAVASLGGGFARGYAYLRIA